MIGELASPNQAFVSVILSALNDAVTAVNRDGIVLYWNQAAEKMYSIAAEDIIGRKIGDFFQRGSLMLFQVMESGLPVYGVYHQPRPDKHVFINTVPVLGEKNALIGAVSIEHDVTDVIRLSEGRYSQQEFVDDTYLSPVLDSSHRGIQTALKFIEQMKKVGQVPPLLITGEPGVGKTHVAQYVHQHCGTKGPFLTVVCDTIQEGLLDLELFGHESDFSSNGTRMQGRVGKLELAKQGTLFLMNIEFMPEKTQSKLAQAITDGYFTKSGGSQCVPLDCRVIAASSRDALDTIGTLHLRRELYYLFHTLDIPSIRHRREDLPTLCHHYLTQAAERLGRPVPQLTSEVMAALTTYAWPGNIPEITRVMEHLVIVAGEEEVTLQDLPRAVRPKTVDEVTQDSVPLSTLSEEVERAKIEDALTKTGGNKASTARLLGISRGALYYKMKQYNMD